MYPMPHPAPQTAEPDITLVKAEPEPMSPALAFEAEVDVPDGYVAARLGEDGPMILALMPSKWRASHLRFLHLGQYDEFATGGEDSTGRYREGIIHPDHRDVWFDADPTQDDMNAWTEALSKAGESVGKSGGRSRSTRPTPRR